MHVFKCNGLIFKQFFETSMNKTQKNFPPIYLNLVVLNKLKLFSRKKPTPPPKFEFLDKK